MRSEGKTFDSMGTYNQLPKLVVCPIERGGGGGGGEFHGEEHVIKSGKAMP